MILPEVLVYGHDARDRAESGRRRRMARLRDGDRMIEIGEWHPDDWNGLLALHRAAGGATLDEARLAVLIDERLRRGPNVTARAGGRIVGHASLVPDAAGSHELVTLTDRAFHSDELERFLVGTLLRLAGRHGADRIWLTGAHHGHRELDRYRRIGFERVMTGTEEVRGRILVAVTRAPSRADGWPGRLQAPPRAASIPGEPPRFAHGGALMPSFLGELLPSRLTGILLVLLGSVALLVRGCQDLPIAESGESTARTMSADRR